MATNPDREYMSVEQYLLLMRNSNNRRYEYHAGHVRAMAGGTSDHAQISGNMYAALDRLLGDETPCRPYVADKMVRVAESRIFLPDVVVSCTRSDHGKTQILESPRLIVEVLSESTAMTDRIIRLPLYQKTPTVEEIVFISQAVQWVELFTRTEIGWHYQQYRSGQRFRLQSLGIELEVAQLYRRLTIPTSPDDHPEE